MNPLASLLIYMVFGLSNLAEQWIHHSPFGPIESGGEASPRGRKSTAEGGENRLDSTCNRSTEPINRSGRDDGSAAEEIGGGGVKIGRESGGHATAGQPPKKSATAG
jgi:hypothetical protein